MSKTCSIRKTNPLTIVYSEICEPFQVALKAEARYFVTLMDNTPVWTTFYSINEKLEMFSWLKAYLAVAKRQTWYKRKALHTDNDDESTNLKYLDSPERRVILSCRTCGNTSKQNGDAERKNRTILNMRGAMKK